MSESDIQISIRRGYPGDAVRLAELHVAVWRATYTDYAPKDAVRLLDVEKRLPYWATALEASEPEKCAWVAQDSRSVLGVISIGSSDHAAFGDRIEVKHLYVAEGAQGRGVGTQLLNTAIQECESVGAPGVALSVVRQNERAREFYRSMGGQEVTNFIDPGPLWRSENVLVTWDFA